MLKTGIQATGTIKREKPEEGYRMIKEAGFDCVDFNFDEYLTVHEVQTGAISDIFDRPMEEMWKDFAPHAEAAAKYGLTFEQMHVPFPMMQKGKDGDYEKMLRVTENCTELCAGTTADILWYILSHCLILAVKKEKYACNKCICS